MAGAVPTVRPDPAGAAFLLVGVGPGAGGVVERWHDDVAALGRPVTLLVLDAPDAAAGPPVEEFARALDRFGVGARVLVAGAEADVWALRAHALDAGLLPGEVLVEVVGDGPLRVFCVHCAATHRVDGEPGGVVRCPGCARLVDVVPHRSAHLGAYLAAAVDPGDDGGAAT
jgi:hypothetical protein